jgi:hypothetical protein
MSQDNDDARSSLRRLARSAVEWGHIRVDAQNLIGAAVDALTAGLDSEGLRELAGMSPRDDIDEVSDVLLRALEQLSVPLPASWTDLAVRLAFGYRCEDFLAGRTNARALTSWAHSNFDHGQNEPSDPLVDLDDGFDEDDTYSKSDAGAVDAAAYARAYIEWLDRPDLFDASTWVRLT